MTGECSPKMCFGPCFCEVVWGGGMALQIRILGVG